MNSLGLTVFAGNIPGLILDFDNSTKEYTVEFADGRVVKTTKVYWDGSIPADKDTALYRLANKNNDETLVFDQEYGWDVVSKEESPDDEDDLCEKCGGDGCPHCDYMGYHIAKIAKPIEITNEPSELNEWVDDYKEEEGAAESTSMDEKLDEVLEILNDVVADSDSEPLDTSAVQKQDYDATEDSYWDRATKPNPMAYDEEFPAGQYNERNPGTLNPKAKVAKECDCWEGYKRVPGTKPCAPGSCEKCDSARKESAAKKKKHDPDEAVKKINRVPPEGVRANARRALKYIEEGKAGDGFQPATADRARKIAAGEELTEEHINRMHSFFERHAGGRSKKAKPGEITAWDVAWLAWGGDSGRSWAAKVDAQLHKARHPKSKGKHSSIEKDSETMYWDPATKNMTVGDDRDDDMNFSDIGGNSNVRHAEGEAQKNQHGDQEGNPWARGMGDPDVYFPEPPLDVTKIVRQQNENLEDPNENVWEKVVSHSHIREEIEWEENKVSGTKCPTCSDPLVDGNCYVCGENKEKEAKIAGQIDALNKIANALKPQAAELGVLFGEALAATEPSEGLYAIEIHGIDSHPENGGTGNYNNTHGDSPEYLKDVNHGGGGWIDPTPEMIIEGMPKVIEYSESDESAEGDTLVKALEKFFDEVFGDLFTENKEKGKKKKKKSSVKTARPVCNICRQEYVGGECALKQAPANCPAENSSEQGSVDTPEMSQSQAPPMGYTQPQYNAPSSMGFAGGGIPGAIGFRGGAVENGTEILDIDNNPIEIDQTYRVFAGIDNEPDIVKITNIDQSGIEMIRIDSAFPDNEGQPYTISPDQVEVEDIRFHKVDEINPNEIGSDTADALAGTPETNDDAGPGQNDIPGQRDLSRGDAAGARPFRSPSGSIIHEAGKHYYPNQQKEFINEPGNARNLDKLILDGTHYVDGETTASENFDDDFLFGV